MHLVEQECQGKRDLLSDLALNTGKVRIALGLESLRHEQQLFDVTLQSVHPDGRQFFGVSLRYCKTDDVHEGSHEGAVRHLGLLSVVILGRQRLDGLVQTVIY